GALAVVVRQRLMTLLRVEALLSVDGVAVNQPEERVCRIERHAVDAEEAALPVHNRSVRTLTEDPDGEEDGNPTGEANGARQEGVTEHDRQEKLECQPKRLVDSGSLDTEDEDDAERTHAERPQHVEQARIDPAPSWQLAHGQPQGAGEHQNDGIL